MSWCILLKQTTLSGFGLSCSSELLSARAQLLSCVDVNETWHWHYRTNILQETL